MKRLWNALLRVLRLKKQKKKTDASIYPMF